MDIIFRKRIEDLPQLAVYLDNGVKVMTSALHFHLAEEIEVCRCQIRWVQKRYYVVCLCETREWRVISVHCRREENLILRVPKIRLPFAECSPWNTLKCCSRTLNWRSGAGGTKFRCIVPYSWRWQPQQVFQIARRLFQENSSAFEMLMPFKPWCTTTRAARVCAPMVAFLFAAPGPHKRTHIAYRIP